ncbi:hypothetical protein E2562_011390 [Oryza meyeriana var. granulata]|uniref:Uncharacterized protein n=1 Tax=Oryza meyeriana var. granulata TaxID=110450 RepID=A0A6G1ECI4_9ORYZ|nr:hypothetical protein E2562_011390 [Oryza meyeriana var. granulata]
MGDDIDFTGELGALGATRYPGPGSASFATHAGIKLDATDIFANGRNATGGIRDAATRGGGGSRCRRQQRSASVPPHRQHTQADYTARASYPGTRASYPGTGYSGAQAGYPGTRAGYPGARADYTAEAGYPGARGDYTSGASYPGAWGCLWEHHQVQGTPRREGLRAATRDRLR